MRDILVGSNRFHHTESKSYPRCMRLSKRQVDDLCFTLCGVNGCHCGAHESFTYNGVPCDLVPFTDGSGDREIVVLN